MSRGGGIGAIIGGIIGFVLAPYTGGTSLSMVYYGAMLGYAVGSFIDPNTPDMATIGVPNPDIQVMSGEIGTPVADLAGTAKIDGHLLCFGKERNEQVITESKGGGKGGGSKTQSQVTGYKYFQSWAVGICAGKVDRLYAIYKNDDAEPVWSSDDGLECPVSGGQETIVIDDIGSCVFYFGTNDQVANSNVGEIIKDADLNTPYRNLCWCFFDDCFIGEYNRTPTYKFIVQKIPEISFSTKNTIQEYDVNPAHALWYIFHDLAGLPESWLYSADFTTIADTLYSESRGICILFSNQQSVLSYIESINTHIDNIIRYGADGKFHPKLIRDDYVDNDLLSIDESVMLDDPNFNRGSWIDTVNEMKVQYSEIINVVRAPSPSPMPEGQWVAALEQRDTDYIYLYDVDNYAVVKVNTAEVNPKVVDFLVINDADYILDHSKGHSGAQRGSYCISKNYNKLWYLFRKTSNGDLKLVEVDITAYPMTITKTSLHSAIVPGESFTDACGNDDYCFFPTSKVSGRILKFDTSHVLTDKEFSYTTGGSAEAISSITINPSELQIAWLYNAPSNIAKVPYASYSFVIDWTLSEPDGGVDAALWQNFLRYDEKYDHIFRQRVYWPANGVAYYYSDWDQNIGRAYVQGLQHMQAYLGGNLLYFYVLHLANSGGSKWLHRFTNQDSTIGGALVQINLDVSTYTNRYNGGSVSVYNENNNKSFLVTYNTTTGRNHFASFNQSLSLVSDFAPDTIYWGQ